MKPGKPMFSDAPRAVSIPVNLASGLLGPYLFCYLAGLRLPESLWPMLSDILYMYLTLLVFVPYFVIVIPILKLFFYGSLKKGLKIRVSNKTKRITTILFIAFTVPIAVFIQARLFIWITDRDAPSEFSAMILNAFYLFVIGAPGLFLSIQKSKVKIAAIEKLRSEATKSQL